ncbi:MAG: EpsI family protein [Alphaproteobacteria bacterium]|nr:EpsI family protein [Alphaproteobacteria bacterium]
MLLLKRFPVGGSKPEREGQGATTLASPPAGQPVAGAAAAPGWRQAVAFIGVAALVFGLVFRRDVAGAVRVWIDSTAYNHCFLILPLVGYLLWERRAVIASVSPRPTLWPLTIMPMLSAFWLVAAILDIQEARQLLLVAMFEVVLLVALGPRLFWLLLAPLMFLFFLVPSGAFLVPTLQKITAQITVAGLGLLGIPTFSDGFMIEIPEGTFEIAEACAGLRFLVASIVFGCFFAVVMYRSTVRRILFIALSVSVPIFANGLRALGIIVLAHLEGSAAAVEADHVLYGWFFFTLVIIILIAIGITFAQKIDRSIPLRSTGWSKPAARRAATAIPAAVMLALIGPAYAARLDAVHPPSPLPGAEAPTVGPPWRAVPAAAADWRPVVKGAGREFLDGFEAPGSGVVVRFVALYHLRASGDALTTTGNRMADDERWHVNAYGRAEVTFAGHPAVVASTEVISGQRRRLVWSFYVVDGRISSGLIETKLLRARAVLLQRVPVAAFVAISASMDDPQAPAEQQLTGFLEASQPLTQYLAMLPR